MHRFVISRALKSAGINTCLLHTSPTCVQSPLRRRRVVVDALSPYVRVGMYSFSARNPSGNHSRDGAIEGEKNLHAYGYKVRIAGLFTSFLSAGYTVCRLHVSRKL